MDNKKKNNKPLRSYRDLVAWQKGMELVEGIYAATRYWPKEELYGLTSQIRRAAISIPSNIAEGQGRSSTKYFLHHLHIAYGSLLEAETQIILAGKLGYASVDETQQLLSTAAEL